MIKALRTLARTTCLFLAGIGAFVALLASCFVGVMTIVWFQDGTFTTDDSRLLTKGAIWLLASGLFTFVTCRLGRRMGECGDNTFRLVLSTSGRSEKLAQDVSQIIFLIISAIWLWAIVPGNIMVRVPSVAGWLALAYFGLHLRVFLHELGHLTAAWLMGFHLGKIQVGVGPHLWSASLQSGLHFELRAWPHGGLVFATPRKTRHFVAQQFLFIGAGPLMDVLILALGYKAIWAAFGGLAAAFMDRPLGMLAVLLFWNTAFSAAGGLIPHAVWFGGRKLQTDGYLLLQLLLPARFKSGPITFTPDRADALAFFQSTPLQDRLSRVAVASPSREASAEPIIFRQQRARLASRLRPVAGTQV